ncbi:MAG TPA: carboxypeptidase-like regulatory domain-containing protein [Planctomycetota bacterium]
MRAGEKANGVVLGSIICPDGDPRDEVDLHLLAQSGRYAEPEFAWGAGGSFRFALPADTYRLRVKLFSGFPGSFEVGGIRVRGGETVELEPIVLDELLHIVLLEVRDESGTPVPDVRVACRSPGFDGWSPLVVVPDPAGTIRLRSLAAPMPRLLIGAPGFLAVELVEPRPVERVVLTRGPRVHLQLSGGLPNLPEPWCLLVNLVADEVWEFSPPIPFDAHGRATLDLTRSGRLYVALALRHPEERGHSGLDGLGWWIEVAPEPGEQSFTSPPPTTEFLDNIERLTRAR